MFANTGIRPFRPLIFSIVATSGRGAMRPKRHPAASAKLAIRTKAPSPRSVDLLLCGHRYRTSCAALAAADAMIVDDRRSAETSVGAQETRDPAPAGTTRRR